MAASLIDITNITLTLIAIVLSFIGIVYYYKGYKKFVGGEFTNYAMWMLYGVIAYTIHLFAHLSYQLNEVGLLNTNQEIVGLVLYIFLALAGIFFFVGSYLYLKLAKTYGFKK